MLSEWLEYCISLSKFGAFWWLYIWEWIEIEYWSHFEVDAVLQSLETGLKDNVKWKSMKKTYW